MQGCCCWSSLRSLAQAPSRDAVRTTRFGIWQHPPAVTPPDAFAGPNTCRLLLDTGNYQTRLRRPACRMLDLSRLLKLVWMCPITVLVLNLPALIINRCMVTQAVYVSLLSKP